MNKEIIIQGIISAIKAEVEGYNFYMMAANSTQDRHGRDVFERLAREEMEHVAFLRAQYRSFLEHDTPDMSIRLNKSVFGINSPIFSDSLKERIRSAHFEMTALSVGIQLELSAIKFYQDQAQKTENAVVKNFFQELSNWETTHYNVLLHQQETLKQAYWSNNEFAPF